MKTTGVVTTLIISVAFPAAILAAEPAAHQHQDMQHNGMHQENAIVPETDGVIVKVDTAAGKLTVRHGPIANLQMEGMTMVFRVKDPSMLSSVKPGDKVKMAVERVDGALTIVAMQPAQ